jgi:hypothetical protein
LSSSLVALSGAGEHQVSLPHVDEVIEIEHTIDIEIRASGRRRSIREQQIIGNDSEEIIEVGEA